MDHLLEVVAHRKFVDARLVEISGEAEQAGAAVLRRAQLRIPIRTTQNDVRHGSQGLRIIDDRRAAPQPDYRREGWTDPRNAALAFERLHQRRFFAHFVSARSTMPINIQIVSAAEDILAQESFGV